MAETRNDAASDGEPNLSDAAVAAPAPVEAADIAALNNQAPPTDDTPTIISRNGPHPRFEEPPGGLRGRKLAHFELIEPIGVGGMAAVIRARDTQLDRLVALKILPPEMADEPDNVQRFHQEARSAARLDHENIARVFFCGEDQTLHFIAFEFVEGDNLRTILERRGRLPAAEALHYILQIAAGLAHASQRGVVHRDIKPSNIIITPAGRAKLVDMGLARSLERQDDEGLTQSGVTLGTFDYISPEQALEPREADFRSDIYSLGCTFYHILTGRPPVPDGTAAKKLHHHQHIKPRDPRELVPGLPDEVAVILDRMMAKRPQDRYQSPEQLVQHLLLAARKLGSPNNLPEGILSVEAALPPPPGGRPLLLAGLAAALVLLVIVALQIFNHPPTKTQTPGPIADSHNAPKPDVGAPAPATQATVGAKDKPAVGAPATTQPPAKPPVVVRYEGDGSDLLDWLQTTDKNAAKEIVLSNDLDLKLPMDGDAGLVVTGPKVTIRAKPGRRPTIRFTHDSRPQGSIPWAAVSIESPDATVSGVRILVDGQASDVRLYGLRLHGPKGESSAFSVDNCEFIQIRPGTGEKRLASLDVASDGSSASLDVTGCRFLSFLGVEYDGFDQDVLTNNIAFGGEDAVLREGAVRITAVNCAFGPHGDVFRLEGGKEGTTAPPLTLDHCSILAGGPTTVFDARADAAVALNVHASLFSRPDPLESAGPAVLIRQDRDAAVFYNDRDDRYHGLDGFRMIGDDPGSWSAFQNWATPGPKPSSVLTDPPWSADDPLAPFRRYNLKKDHEDYFASAFRIKDSSANLRVANDKSSPIGVQSLGGVDYVEALRKADRIADDAQQRRRIVDPSVVSGSANRVYKTLAEALTACESGDEVVLRFDGPLAVEPYRLGPKNVQDVTIRAEPGRRPILQLTAAKDSDPEPAMFRLYDGKLRLEGLEFVLRPDQDRLDRQSVIDLVGQGSCTLKNCIITMDRASRTNTRLAVVWLADPAKAMMLPMRSADQPAQLTFDGCFVRGDGDLVACQLSRPLALDATNTLMALKGCFLNVDSGSAAPPPPSDLMNLTLKKVTAYLTGNLIRLHAKDYLTPVQCTPSDSLFVAAAKEPMIQLADATFDQKPLESVLKWQGGGRIDYGNYDVMLDQNPPGDVMRQAPIMSDKWEALWGNNAGDKQVKSFRWAGAPPSADGPFHTAVPLQFRPLDASDACGADVDNLDRQLSPTASK
jgi:serine/threonine protein kinase